MGSYLSNLRDNFQKNEGLTKYLRNFEVVVY